MMAIVSHNYYPGHITIEIDQGTFNYNKNTLDKINLVSPQETVVLWRIEGKYDSGRYVCQQCSSR
jgi:hypothetical protein